MKEMMLKHGPKGAVQQLLLPWAVEGQYLLAVYLDYMNYRYIYISKGAGWSTARKMTDSLNQ